MGPGVDGVLAGLVRGDVPALYVLLDAGDRIVEANTHTRALLGPGALGARFGDLCVTFQRGLSPTAEARGGPVRRDVNLVAFTGLPQTYQCWFAPADGHTVVVGGADPAEQEVLRRELLSANQRLSAGTRELQQANAELARTGQLKTQFIGMAAHDLRSPLLTVDAYARFLAEDLDGRLEPEQAAQLAGIREATALMRQIVDGFLDVAIVESGRLRLDRSPASLVRVATEALGLVRTAALRRGVAVRVQAAELPDLPLDVPRLKQVVMNLANNAVQHSPPGAEVVVEVAWEAGQAVLRVRDQGPGLAPEIARDLFSAFTRGRDRADPRDRHAGLGLAISRLIVNAHGGTIAATGAPGQGAVFEVRLPAAPA